MSSIRETQDRIQALFYHVQDCSLCGRIPVKPGDGIPPMACDEGKRLAYGWLTYAARNGNKDAEKILSTLQEGNYDPQSLLPPEYKNPELREE